MKVLVTVGISSLACDYLGERMASFFGITSAKYQYAIDEYYRMKKEVRSWTHKTVFMRLNVDENFL